MIHLFVAVAAWKGVANAIGVIVVIYGALYLLAGPWVPGVVTAASVLAWVMPGALAQALMFFGLCALLVGIGVVLWWVTGKVWPTLGDQYRAAVRKGDTSAWWARRTLSDRAEDLLRRHAPELLRDEVTEEIDATPLPTPLLPPPTRWELPAAQPGEEDR